MKRKRSLLPLILTVIPGLGHFYLSRFLRAFIYALGFFGPILIIAFFTVQNARFSNDAFFMLSLISACVWAISFIDMILTLILYRSSDDALHEIPAPSQISSEQRGKANFMVMSLIPGLGHYQLGLMHRGLTAMIAFFGTGIMIVFISNLINNEGFFIFLLALPILWFYTLFDSMQQYHRKQNGLELIDRSLFEDFQDGYNGGKKNKSLATILAIVPGAAHLYLGLQKRGLQLMAIFLLSFYILDVLRLSLFLFLLPLLWFFSFFDALQSISAQEKGPIEDKPLVSSWVQHQGKLGVLLIILGSYYVFNQFIVRILQRWFDSIPITYWVSVYSQTLLVSLLLIGGGIWLVRRRSLNKS